MLSLQAGRGLAAVLVVVHHAALTTGLVQFGAGRLGVEFFFVLSGLVILLAHWKDIGQPQRAASFAWKRFRRIYPIYWIVLLPQMVWIVLRPRQGNEKLYQQNPWVIVSNLVLVHIHSVQVTITVAWTLFHEILFYAVFALLLANRYVGAVLFTAWIAASFFFFDGAHGIYWGFVFSPLHLIFAMGMVAAWAIRRGPIPWPYVLATVGIAMFGRACYVSNLNNDGTDANNLLAGLGAALMILAGVELERRGIFRVPSFLSFLGDASYSIYLLHYPILYAFTPRGLQWWSKHHLPLAAWITLSAIVATALGCVLHRFVERPLLRRFGGFRHPAAI